MQIDLSLAETKLILEAEFDPLDNAVVGLVSKLDEHRTKLEELEDIDLNDCLGGACKL